RRSAKACIQEAKACCRLLGSNRANPRPNVSWEGIPCVRSRNSESQAALACPQWAISTQFWAPQMVARIVIVRIVSRGCHVVACWRRGSWTTAKKAKSCSIPVGWAIALSSEAKMGTTRQLQQRTRYNTSTAHKLVDAMALMGRADVFYALSLVWYDNAPLTQYIHMKTLPGTQTERVRFLFNRLSILVQLQVERTRCP